METMKISKELVKEPILAYFDAVNLSRRLYRMNKMNASRYVNSIANSISNEHPYVKLGDAVDLSEFMENYCINTVCDTFKVTIPQMMAKDRRMQIRIPKHTLCFLLHKYCGHTLSYIGKKFNMHHSSIIHACESVEKLMFEHNYTQSELSRKSAFCIDLVADRIKDVRKFDNE